MPRHIVCLTFDFDVVSIPIARGQTTPTALSRGEFGLVGADRLLDLLAARGLPATWLSRATPWKVFRRLARAFTRPAMKLATMAGPIDSRRPCQQRKKNKNCYALIWRSRRLPVRRAAIARRPGTSARPPSIC